MSEAGSSASAIPEKMSGDQSRGKTKQGDRGGGGNGDGGGGGGGGGGDDDGS